MSNNNYENYNEEWKSCRETVAKFDNTLIDLRKYGFTIITGILTAGSFLGFNEPTVSLQVGVIIVTMTLVVILYWMDIYYQNLLYGSILRTNFLEIFKLGRGLSFYISKLFGRSGMGALLHILYAGFLIAAFILGMFAAALSGNAVVPSTSQITKIYTNHSGNAVVPSTSQITKINTNSSKCTFPMNFCDTSSLLYVSLGLGGLAMGIIFAFFDQVRSNNGKIINRIMEIKKRELDGLRGIAKAAPNRIMDIIQETEDDIHKVLTKHIGRYQLWSLTRIKNDAKFLLELKNLTQ